MTPPKALPYELKLFDQLMVIELGHYRPHANMRVLESTFGIAGALLAELRLGGHIFVGSEPKPTVTPLDSTQPLDDLLEWAKSSISGTVRVRGVIKQLAGAPDLRPTAIGRLQDSGLFEVEQKKIGGINSSVRYQELHPTVREDLEAHLISVLETGALPDPEMSMLLSLARATKLLNRAFGALMIRRAKGRLKELVGDEPIGAETRSAVSKAVARRAAWNGAVAGSRPH